MVFFSESVQMKIYTEIAGIPGAWYAGRIRLPVRPGFSFRCLFFGPDAHRLYRQLGGRRWVWNAVTSSLVFPLPLLGVFSVVNTVALSQVCAHTRPPSGTCLGEWRKNEVETIRHAYDTIIRRCEISAYHCTQKCRPFWNCTCIFWDVTYMLTWCGTCYY